MATLLYRKGGTLVTASGGNTGKSAPGLCVISNTLDCTDLLSATATGTFAVPVYTDVVELIALPANCKVLDVVITLLTPGTASGTVGVGMGGATSGFLATFAIDGTAGTDDTCVADALSMAAASGQIYSSADTIDVIFNTAGPGAAKIRVEALVWMFSGNT